TAAPGAMTSDRMSKLSLQHRPDPQSSPPTSSVVQLPQPPPVIVSSDPAVHDQFDSSVISKSRFPERRTEPPTVRRDVESSVSLDPRRLYPLVSSIVPSSASQLPEPVTSALTRRTAPFATRTTPLLE